jgi:PAS domain S-box-containing protein
MSEVTANSNIDLPELERRYHQLMELYPDLACICVAGRIASVNTAGARLLGAQDPRQLIGRPISDFFHPDFRASVIERLARLGRNGTMSLEEEKWITLNGTDIDVEVTAAAGADQDQPAFQLIARDVTRRKQAEEMLHDSEERHHGLLNLYLDLIGVQSARTSELQVALSRAQEVDRLKSQLLSIVSHELRTPLASILGQTTTLLDYAERISPAEQLEALRIVNEEAARLDELIGHLLDMSRIESGTLRVEPVATDLRPILQEIINATAVQAPDHVTQSNLPPLPLVQADPRRVRQVIGNLLDNAIKFSPPGSTVAVDAEVNTKFITVHVRDQGPGILPEHLPHILDRFYRAEEKGVRARGVGLGLAICKGLVEAMGGSITVASQVGQGSVFSFSLPRTQGVNKYGQE